MESEESDYGEESIYNEEKNENLSNSNIDISKQIAINQSHEGEYNDLEAQKIKNDLLINFKRSDRDLEKTTINPIHNFGYLPKRLKNNAKKEFSLFNQNEKKNLIIQNLQNQKRFSMIDENLRKEKTILSGQESLVEKDLVHENNNDNNEYNNNHETSKTRNSASNSANNKIDSIPFDKSNMSLNKINNDTNKIIKIPLPKSRESIVKSASIKSKSSHSDANVIINKEKRPSNTKTVDVDTELVLPEIIKNDSRKSLVSRNKSYDYSKNENFGYSGLNTSVDNQKLNLSSANNNETYLPRIPSSKKKTGKREKLNNEIEYFELEKENYELREKLKLLNDELSKMVEKLYHQSNNKKTHRNHYNNKTIPKEIEISNKTLNCLISEYNTLFKRFYQISEPYYYDNLVKINDNCQKLIKEFETLNKDVTKKNRADEALLAKKNKINVDEDLDLKKLEDINFKIKYYEENKIKTENEIDRIKNQLYYEEQNYLKEREKNEKLIELYNNYNTNIEEDSINLFQTKVNSEFVKKKENLMKKLKILEHSNVAIKNSFLIEKDNKLRNIYTLELKIQDLKRKINEKNKF